MDRKFVVSFMVALVGKIVVLPENFNVVVNTGVSTGLIIVVNIELPITLTSDAEDFILVIFKDLKDDTVARENLLLFGSIEVLPETDIAVNGAILVDDDANMAVGLNISEFIVRVAVESPVKILVSPVATVLERLIVVVLAATVEGFVVLELTETDFLLVLELAEEVARVIESVIVLIAGICEVAGVD